MLLEAVVFSPLAILIMSSDHCSPSSTISTKDSHHISLHQPSPPSQTQESQTLLTSEESQEKCPSFADPDSDSSSDSEITTKPQRESPRIAALKAKKAAGTAASSLPSSSDGSSTLVPGGCCELETSSYWTPLQYWASGTQAS